MTPGPYQSNLFRFVIGQYRQGMDRHSRAVRGARTTATWGLGVGATVTFLPLVSLAKASHDAGRRLRASVTSRRSFRIRSQADKLLDFSDFDGLSDLDAGLGDDASVEKAIDLLEHQAISRTLLAVGACLSPRQVKLLSSQKTEILGDPSDDASEREPVGKSSLISSITSFFTGRFTTWRKPATANLSRPASVGLDPLEDADNQLTQPTRGLSAMGRVTGVASDVKTRSLVLIRGHNIVWQGLSLAQQRHLKEKIELFLKGGYPIQGDELAWLRRCSLSHGESSVLNGTRQLSRQLLGGQPPSTGDQQALIQTFIPNALLPGSFVTSLVRPVRTFWIEVLRVLAWLSQRRGYDSVESLLGRLMPLGRSAPTGGRLVSATVATDAADVKPEVSTMAPVTWVKRLLAGLLPLTILTPKAIAISTTSSDAIVIAGSSVANTGLVQQDVIAKQSMMTRRVDISVVNQPSVENSDWLEAHVLSVDYIEHPLEKVLKWVDRLLLWLEVRWQSLWQSFRACWAGWLP